MGGPSQSLLDALHGVQLWGIVRSDTGGRCGRNDEFLVAFKRLEEEVSNVEEENAKLRKLVCDLHKALFTLDIDHCQACSRDNINGPCTKFAPWGNDECSIEEVMRELGIEVE